MQTSSAGTVSILEIVVLAFAMAGGLFSFALLAIYYLDKRRLRKAGVNGIFRRIANGNIRNELSRFWMLAGFAYITALYMTLPPYTRSADRDAAAWAGYVIFSWIIFLVAGSLWDFLDRARNWRDVPDITALLDTTIIQKEGQQP